MFVFVSSRQKNAIKLPSHQAIRRGCRQGLYSANLKCAVVAVSSKSQCIQVLPKSLLGAGQFSRLPEPLLLHGCFDGLSHVCNTLQHELHRPACCVSPHGGGFPISSNVSSSPVKQTRREAHGCRVRKHANTAPARGAGNFDSTVHMDTFSPGAPKRAHTSSMSVAGGTRSIRARLACTSSRPTRPPARPGVSHQMSTGQGTHFSLWALLTFLAAPCAGHVAQMLARGLHIFAGQRQQGVRCRGPAQRNDAARVRTRRGSAACRGDPALGAPFSLVTPHTGLIVTNLGSHLSGTCRVSCGVEKGITGARWTRRPAPGLAECPHREGWGANMVSACVCTSPGDATLLVLACMFALCESTACPRYRLRNVMCAVNRRIVIRSSS